jgi:16S rRNA (uracil1498-N3)-methyltransferase
MEKTLTRFYCDPITPPNVQLNQTESHHLIHVMRLSQGTCVELFDGKGATATAIITKLTRKSVELETEEIKVTPPRTTSRIIIASSIAKGSRFDDIIAKCTELAADHIAPVIFEKTVKLARNSAAIDRYTKLTITAAKQSRRNFLPRISPPLPLQKTIKTLKADYPAAHLIIGSLSPDAKTIDQLPNDNRDKIVFIGPEAGISIQEHALLEKHKAIETRLTNTTLRIETAAIAFTAILAATRK